MEPSTFFAHANPARANSIMLQRVYIETTFVSYLTARSSRDGVVAGPEELKKVIP